MKKTVCYVIVVLMNSCSLMGVNSSEFKELVTIMKDPAARYSIVYNRLRSLVKNNDAIVKEKEDETGNTLLHYSQYLGWAQLDKKLISLGADPNITNVLGKRPADIISKDAVKNLKKLKYNEYQK